MWAAVKSMRAATAILTGAILQSLRADRPP